MNLLNNYYYFNNALSKDFCKEVINFALNKKEEIKEGVTGFQEKVDENKMKDIRKIRKSNVVWLKENWIYKEIIPFILDANNLADWNFQLSKPESIQFTMYGKGQYYGWHADSFPFSSKEKKLDGFEGMTRKLSVTVSLNDGDEYSGGYFEIDNRNNFHEKNIHRLKLIRKAGSLVVFPSFLYHRVTPVTKGTRYSLVIWMNGKPFA
jgi:PKHD-type hydroxylase